MKKFWLIIPWLLFSYSAYSQNTPVQVIKSGKLLLSEWKILDESYGEVFPGSEYFTGNPVSFSLEPNRRYFFSVSVKDEKVNDSILFLLILNKEPILLVKPDIGMGDHLLPFFTGVKREGAKIVGGTDAVISDFPWQVYVIAGSYRCGGSIIAPDWILTAAHCTKDDSGNTISPNVVYVTAGSSSTSGQLYQAASLIPHENYNDATNENDVALIKLKVPINISGARPIKLIYPADVQAGATDPGVLSWVSGWGLTHVNPNVFPSTLQKVQLPIVSNTQASVVWRTIPSTSMMAGYLNGNKDACNGDSGGPLAVKVLDEYRLAGVVSWGSSTCDTYGGYARVSLFTDWIKGKTGITQLFRPPAPSGDTLICAGQTASTYTVGAVTGTTAFEWSLSPSYAGSVTNATATSATINWSPGFTGYAFLKFRATVSGALSDWSGRGMRIAPVTSMISRSNDTTICTNQPVTLSVKAEGYVLNYIWYKDGIFIQSGPLPKLEIISATIYNSGNYYVKIEGRCGTVLSPVIHLTVLPLTAINSLSPDTNIPFGSDFTLEVNAAGHNLIYEWQKDSTLLGSTVDPTLLLHNVNAGDIGLYRVIVSGTCGTEISKNIYLFVTGSSYSGGPGVYLWPSVTNDNFNVAISNEELYNLQIFNAGGKLLKVYNNLHYQVVINIGMLPRGIYLVRIFNSNFSKVLKVIKS